MERFAYHNLEKIDFYPRSEPKEADKIVVKMWAPRGEICGYGLKPLVQAPARGRGLSIEVRPENFAVLATAKTMYVYAANFVERKKVREKETEDETPYINCMPFANSALRCESSRRLNFARFFFRDGSPGGRPLGGSDGCFDGHAPRTVGGQTWVP